MPRNNRYLHTDIKRNDAHINFLIDVKYIWSLSRKNPNIWDEMDLNKNWEKKAI